MAEISSSRMPMFTQNVTLFYQSIMALHASSPIQNIIGTVNLTFGCLSAKNLINSFRHDDQTSPSATKITTWQITGIKVIDFCGDLSSVLGGIQSRPAIFVWNWAIHQLLSPANIERLFGETALLSSQRLNYTIATASFLLGVPSTLKTIYTCYQWIAANKKKLPAEKTASEKPQNRKGTILIERKKRQSKFPVRSTDIYTTGRIAMRTVGAASALLLTPRK